MIKIVDRKVKSYKDCKFTFAIDKMPKNIHYENCIFEDPEGKKSCYILDGEFPLICFSLGYTDNNIFHIILSKDLQGFGEDFDTIIRLKSIQSKVFSFNYGPLFFMNNSNQWKTLQDLTRRD